MKNSKMLLFLVVFTVINAPAFPASHNAGGEQGDGDVAQINPSDFEFKANGSVKYLTIELKSDLMGTFPRNALLHAYQSGKHLLYVQTEAGKEGF